MEGITAAFFEDYCERGENFHNILNAENIDEICVHIGEFSDYLMTEIRTKECHNTCYYQVYEKGIDRKGKNKS